jgi:hypothetical protein
MTSSLELQPVTMTATTQIHAPAIITGRGATRLTALHTGPHGDVVDDRLRTSNCRDDFSSTTYAYPTQVEALRRAGDAYRRTRLTPGVQRSFERYFRFTRW